MNIIKSIRYRSSRKRTCMFFLFTVSRPIEYSVSKCNLCIDIVAVYEEFSIFSLSIFFLAQITFESRLSEFCTDSNLLQIIFISHFIHSQKETKKFWNFDLFCDGLFHSISVSFRMLFLANWIQHGIQFHKADLSSCAPMRYLWIWITWTVDTYDEFHFSTIFFLITLNTLHQATRRYTM